MIPTEMKNLTYFPSPLAGEGKGRGGSRQSPSLSGTLPLRQPPAWQRELMQAITEPEDLLDMLGLGRDWLPAARGAARLFPLKVPRGFAARIRRGDPHDPLLRQVLPLAQETLDVEGFVPDAVGDIDAQLAPGVLQKYHGRVLLTATGACAVHCRYCFRRQFPYAEANASADHWHDALELIAADASVREVILSGGDPLTLSDRRLREFIDALNSIAHVERLRIHTRLPIVLPSRVDDGLLDWLGQARPAVILVVHANHANEIDAEVHAALVRLNAATAALLNQSVLLRGINDDVAVLTELSERLFQSGVLPYYLHLLDRTQGVAHFEVPQDWAQRLHAELCARLPGYLVPRLVREIAGAPNKVSMGTF